MYKQNHFAIQQKLTQHCKPTILQLKKQNTSIIAKTEFQSFFSFCQSACSRSVQFLPSLE